MNATEALSKIAELLGMKFKSEKFFQTKLVEGETDITKNHEGPFTVGEALFVVGEGSILLPAPAGEHITREGLKLEVSEDGVIREISEAEPAEETRVGEAETEIEVDTEVMSKATLADGTVIETDEEGEFAVGQKLFVITESGEKVGAPEGMHTTESGIVITVDADSIITGVKYPDTEGEGSLEEYKKSMEDMKKAMTEMMSLMSSFSKDLESYKKDYEEFKKQPNFTEPVVKKSFCKVNLIDAKYEFLKQNSLK
jgi:hypothetical protein